MPKIGLYLSSIVTLLTFTCAVGAENKPSAKELRKYLKEYDCTVDYDKHLDYIQICGDGEGHAIWAYIPFDGNALIKVCKGKRKGKRYFMGPGDESNDFWTYKSKKGEMKISVEREWSSLTIGHKDYTGDCSYEGRQRTNRRRAPRDWDED